MLMLLLLSLCVATTAGFLHNDNVVNTKGTTLKHVIQTHAVVQGFADAPTQHSLKFCKGKPVHSVAILATPLSSDFRFSPTRNLFPQKALQMYAEFTRPDPCMFINYCSKFDKCICAA